ncbi:MAG: D-alanine--poly(phosphoribitol) ligase subunit DltA [Oscillospiraceae bacterium]|nr:D-alanine--poly(phosphoribitol) ligase subunit DltA [Oscillospiraceae bacterium]
MTILEKIDHFGNTVPDKTAFSSEEGAITYGELLLYSGRLARYLQKTLPAPQNPIAVYGHKSPYMLVCFLAAARLGRPYVPVDRFIPPYRLNRILKESQAALVLALDELGFEHPQMRKEEILSVCADSAWDAGDPFPAPLGTDILYLMFTSGSSGQPKGVPVSYSNAESFLSWAETFLESGEEAPVFLNQAPYSFDLSVMDTYLALTTGARVYSLTKAVQTDFSRLYGAFRESGVTLWVSTPSFAEMCMVDKSFCQEMLPGLRRFFFCGETLRPALARALKRRFPKAKLFNFYGPTEATVAVTAAEITDKMLEFIDALPVGRVKPGGMIRIVDEMGEPLPDETCGEIVIISDSVARDYWNPEKTLFSRFRIWEEVGVRKWSFRTGDRGYLKDGMLYFCGRMDQQIKYRGYRVEPGDVESNMELLPAVQNAVVLPRYRHNFVVGLQAAVTLRHAPQPGDFGQIAEIRKALSQLIPDYMVPKKIVILDRMPLSSNGKINRAEVKELLENERRSYFADDCRVVRR